MNPKLSAWAACESEFFFDSTPIAPPGSAMLMQVKPGDRASWAFNAKKAWYVGPCLNHYRSFRGVLPSTKGERISDGVKFQHHAIAIPELTPADRILEATRQLKHAITQQPTKAPMDELQAIKLLRKVMLGEDKEPLPKNSVQQSKIRRTTTPMPVLKATTTPVNYISDDEDEDIPPKPRQSKRVQRRIRSE